MEDVPHPKIQSQVKLANQEIQQTTLHKYFTKS